MKGSMHSVGGSRLGSSVAILGALTLLLSGCVWMYVDNGLKDVAPEEYHRPQTPQPVQLSFAFQNKGTTYAPSTNLLRQQVIDSVIASGIFESVTDHSVPGGAVLRITIENVEITHDFLGLNVTDNYDCSLVYQSSPGAPKISKTVRHRIYSTVGAKRVSPNGTNPQKPDEALLTVTRQSVENGLKALLEDPAFGK